jgi:protein TonB
MVVLGGSGQVVRVEVLGESGTRVLDESAVRAFNKAGPFPNPPKALLGRDGTVQIRWEFILKT